MPQHKKDCKILNCKIEKTVADRLGEFTKETGLTKTVTVEKALANYIDQYNATGEI